MYVSLSIGIGLVTTLVAGLHWGALTALLAYLLLTLWQLRRRLATLERRLQEGMDYLPDLVEQIWKVREREPRTDRIAARDDA